MKIGTKVRVINEGNRAERHGFDVGAVVTSEGDSFLHGMKVWELFVDETGFSQYLLPEHYEIISDTKAVEKVVDSELPTKVVYAVLNAKDEVYATTDDRDYAREIKSALGGKRKGIRIFQCSATKEIR